MKKVFTIILGMLLISTLQLNAAFLKNIEKTITQPDGTIINCFSSGDEFHNWLHDKDNYTIIQSQKDGYYYYAVKKDDEIVPSEYKVGTTLLKSTNIQPGVNISAEQWRQKRDRKKVENPIQVEKLKTASTSEININQICIYIRFSDDAEWDQDTSKYYDWMNDEDPSAVSMINFYKEVSYGKVEMRSHFYPRSTTSQVLSYQDSKPRGYFQEYNETSNPGGYDPDNTDRSSEDNSDKREWDLLERAIDYFNANYTVPEGMNLDIVNTNGELISDGLVDNVEFFVLGENGAWSSLLWPHKWSLWDRNAKIGDLRVYSYNFQIQSITNQRGVGVLSHEMGHTLGYPDLYQYEEGSTSDPVGPWDIMATTGTIPQSFGAYTKYRYGNWISSIPEITTAGTYTLNPLDSINNNCFKIASPYTTEEFFLLEYRKKAGRFEIGLPGSGLLIYRINPSVRGNANASVGIEPDEVYIYRPGGSTFVNGDLSQAHFAANEGRTEINNSTDPTPFLFNGGLGGLYISEVSQARNTISFRVDFYPNALYPVFNASKQDIFARGRVTFSDLSLGTPDSWEWTFEGGSPSTYIGQTPPAIQYKTPGTYDVKLKITEGTEVLTEFRDDYITVTELPGANPPRNLTLAISDANPSDVVLNWTEPASGLQEFTIQWDDGERDSAIGDSDSPDSFDALSHWEPSDLLPYDSMYITEISFYPNNNSSVPTTNNYALKIYTESDLRTLAVDQAIPSSDITFNQWNTFTLATPYQIDASKDLWFGANNNSGEAISGYPFGADAGPANSMKGDIIYYANSNNIYSMSAEWGLDRNWNMAATVVTSIEPSSQNSTKLQKVQANNYKSLSGYNIYRDDVQINTTVITDESFTDVDVPDGNYNYYITAVYTAGESPESNIENISVLHNVGIPQVEIKTLSVYPNPTKDKLHVQLEEYAEDLSIQIYDQLGKLVYNQELTSASDMIEIAVNHLADGAYTLVIYNTEKAFKAKFIVLK